MSDNKKGSGKKVETFKKWETRGLLAHIQHIHADHDERRFAFILGAGASKQSGIKTGSELVDDWLKELQERYDPKFGKRPLEEWAVELNLDIKGFSYEKREKFYSDVYEKRFGDDPAEGFGVLENFALPGLAWV